MGHAGHPGKHLSGRTEGVGVVGGGYRYHLQRCIKYYFLEFFTPTLRSGLDHPSSRPEARLRKIATPQPGAPGAPQPPPAPAAPPSAPTPGASCERTYGISKSALSHATSCMVGRSSGDGLSMRASSAATGSGRSFPAKRHITTLSRAMRALGLWSSSSQASHQYMYRSSSILLADHGKNAVNITYVDTPKAHTSAAPAL
jgi:hypothetical protein